MSRQCILTGKKPKAGKSYTLRGIAKKKKGIGLKITGCNKRRFNPNLQDKKIWIPSEKRFVTLRLSTAALRTIDKKGIEAVIHQIRKDGKRI